MTSPAVDPEQHTARGNGEAVLGLADGPWRPGWVFEGGGVDGEVVGHGGERGADDPFLQLDLHLDGQISALREVIEEHAVRGVLEGKGVLDLRLVVDGLRILVRTEDLVEDVLQAGLCDGDDVGWLLVELVLGGRDPLVDGLVVLDDADNVLGVVFEVGLGRVDDEPDLLNEGRGGLDLAADGAGYR